ncbi:MAG: hypothetical protein GY744_18530 [Gammaproteobacteria bacterium]|nr:hypothetical protein [Gammaproteobacteria bacterium]
MVTQIPKDTLEALRKSTNKAQVLGGSQFKQRMEHELERPVESMGMVVIENLMFSRS